MVNIIQTVYNESVLRHPDAISPVFLVYRDTAEERNPDSYFLIQAGVLM